MWLSFPSPTRTLPLRILGVLASPSPSPAMAASWACSRCTFINASTSNRSCEVCDFPLASPPSRSPLPAAGSSSSSSASAVSPYRWSCRFCTLVNYPSNAACAVCGGARYAADEKAVVEVDDDDDVGAADVGSVFFPLRRCSASVRRRKSPSPKVIELGDDDDVKKNKKIKDEEKIDLENKKMKDYEQAVIHLLPEGGAKGDSEKRKLKIMSYNVWFREDLEVQRRMDALGVQIRRHSPDVICFQEVTFNIYELFRSSDWWKEYVCSVPHNMTVVDRSYFCMQMSKLPDSSFSCQPFTNSIMGRELCIAKIPVGKDLSLVIATSHLESPCPAPPKWDQMYSKERQYQAKESVNLLSDKQNVIFGGDMNWDEKLDGNFPLPEGWIDAWARLRPEEDGWTYDTEANGMLSGNRKLQRRLDRFVCKLADFEIDGIEMVGKEAIPGVKYLKEKKVRKQVQKLELPVLPSDHFGLLLTISCRNAA